MSYETLEPVPPKVTSRGVKMSCRVSKRTPQGTVLLSIPLEGVKEAGGDRNSAFQVAVGKEADQGYLRVTVSKDGRFRNNFKYLKGGAERGWFVFRLRGPRLRRARMRPQSCAATRWCTSIY